MSPFRPFLNSIRAVILDGGLASELERRGADLRDPLWSAKLLIDNPALIRDVHLDYFRSGADIGVSASYQASYLGFVQRGLSPRDASELLRHSVRLVREARDEFWASQPADRLKPLIAASIGCYGATLADGSEYRGHYELDAADLADWHRPRLETLLEENPDILACETIPCLSEAEALARLLAVFPDVPAWVSFCCRDETTLSSGEPLAEAVRMVNEFANVAAIGINCTSPVFAESLIKIVKEATTKAIIAYPNRGGLWNAATKSWDNADAPLDWGVAGRSWHAAGATLLGGCCRTTPDDIRRLRAAVCHPHS